MCRFLNYVLIVRVHVCLWLCVAWAFECGMFVFVCVCAFVGVCPYVHKCVSVFVLGRTGAIACVDLLVCVRKCVFVIVSLSLFMCCTCVSVGVCVCMRVCVLCLCFVYCVLRLWV